MKKDPTAAPPGADATQGSEFPVWAPRGLRDVYSSKAVPKALTDEERVYFKDLLTRPAMEAVWNDIKQKGLTEDGFAMAFFKAYRGPKQEECFTPKEQAHRLEEARKKATELAELVRDTRWDDWISENLAESGMRQVDEAKPGSWNLSTKFSFVLEQFDIYAGNRMRLSVLGRPRKNAAAEIYFKRDLSDYCDRTIGDPCYEIVTQAALLIWGGSGDLQDAVQLTRKQILATPSAEWAISPAADAKEGRRSFNHLSELLKTKKRKS